MKKTFLLLIFILGISFLGWSQLTTTDDFNYADNTFLTANGWIAHSGSGTLPIAVGASNGLSYPGYSGITGITGVVEGNAARVVANGEDDSKIFTAVTSGTIYYSILVNVTTAVAGYSMHLGSSPTTFAARIFIKPSATAGKINFGISNTSTAAYAAIPTDFNPLTTYLLVVKYDVLTAGTVSLWVVASGVPSTEALAGSPEVSSTGSGLATIERFCLRQYSGPSLVVDGLRIGMSWADILNPSLPSVATPEFTPAPGLYYTPQDVTITCATADATIYYTTNGNDPDSLSTLFDPLTPITVSVSTTVKAIAYKTGLNPSSIAIGQYRFPIEVADMATLRAGATDGSVYKLTGEAIVTFTRPNDATGRNQKYVQDATGAILIDDLSGIITTLYNLGDGVTGLTGTLTLYNQLLEFIPVSDPGTATSTGNVIVPEVKTLATLTSADQAKLVSIAGITFDTPGGTYTAGTNYTITDPSGAGVFRTAFAESDYIGTIMPAGANDMIVLVGQYGTAMQITPRSLADITSPPSLSVNPTSLSGLDYFFGAGPSASQSFAITGSNLIPSGSNLMVYGSTNYEVANDGVNFGPSALVEYTGGSLTAVDVWVRLKADLAIGAYNGETVTISGGGATDQTVTCNGNVLAPAPYIGVGSLTDFGNQVINTLSAPQSYLVSGNYLTGNIEITPFPGFLISLIPEGPYAADPIILTPVDGIVPDTSIYVVFFPDALQLYSGNIAHVSSGATTQYVAVSGTGVKGEPTNHVTGFAAGTVTTTEIPLTWTDATGAILPEAYLIKGSATSFAAIVDPADGTPEPNSALVQNVLQGVGTYTFTGLTPATPYYFKIYPYTNSLTAINYKTSPAAPEATATTAEPPVITYAWIGADLGVWTDAANWSPVRTTPAATDILMFNDGTTKTITGLPTETIGRLLMTNNTIVNLQSSAVALLTIAGGTGTDLEVSTGCALNCNTINAITIALSAGATGSITGSMAFSSTVNTAHKLTATDAGAVLFGDGSTFTAGAFFTSNPFGTTSLNSIIFTSGSTYVHVAGSNPFGAGQPSSVVVFQTGSLYKLKGTATPSFSGRTYANFEMDTLGVTTTPTGTGAVSIDNLTITNGTLNFNVTATPGHSIKGNIHVAATGTLNFSPASAGTVKLNGLVLQTLSGAGAITTSINSTIEVDNGSGIALTNNVRVNGSLKLTNGQVNLGAGNLTLGPGLTTGIITGTPTASTMIVATGSGELRKEFSAAGSFTFPVGDNDGIAEYSPVTLTFASGTFPAGANYAGVNLVNTKYPDDPNPTNYLNRYWNLSQSGITDFSCNAMFQYVTDDIIGDENLISCVRVLPLPFTLFDPANTTLHQLTANGLTDFSTFTGTRMQTEPVVYDVTGSGSYCQGGIGLPVYLSGSETNATYQLKKDDVPLGDSVAGTGSALVWYNQTAGTYTVVATNIYGISATMNGSAIITETPNVPVSVSIVASENPVFTGTTVIFTATPVNGGIAPSYQWIVNAINVGTNSDTYSYVPLNNDAVSCVLTSSETCTTGSPATSNTVNMVVTNVPANITVTGSVLEEEAVCYNAYQTITVAGGATTFTVEFGGTAEMIAGLNILYKPGTWVKAGGNMLGRISTDNHYCGGITPTMAKTVTGTTEVPFVTNTSSFKIYPNPTTGDFTLEQKGEKVNENVTVEIYGMTGEKLLTSKMTGERKHLFSFSDAPFGIYFVKIITNDLIETTKLIKQ